MTVPTLKPESVLATAADRAKAEVAGWPAWMRTVAEARS